MLPPTGRKPLVPAPRIMSLPHMVNPNKEHVEARAPLSTCHCHVGTNEPLMYSISPQTRAVTAQRAHRKVFPLSHGDCSHFQPLWNVDLCRSHNKAWTRLTLHDKGCIKGLSPYETCYRIYTLMDEVILSDASIKLCVRPWRHTDTSKYKIKSTTALPMQKTDNYSLCPKDNTDPTREGKPSSVFCWVIWPSLYL